MYLNQNGNGTIICSKRRQTKKLDKGYTDHRSLGIKNCRFVNLGHKFIEFMVEPLRNDQNVIMTQFRYFPRKAQNNNSKLNQLIIQICKYNIKQIGFKHNYVVQG